MGGPSYIYTTVCSFTRSSTFQVRLSRKDYLPYPDRIADNTQVR